MSSLAQAWSTIGFFAWPVRSDWQSVVVWWELRRIPYDIVVGLVGAISLGSTWALIYFFGGLKVGQDPIEPVALVFLPLLVGFIFNACYTAGWIVELMVRSNSDAEYRPLGAILFTGGLLFSLALVSLPAVDALAYVVVKRLAG